MNLTQQMNLLIKKIQLNDTVFRKIIKQPIIQPTPPEITPNIDLKTEDFLLTMMILIHLRSLN